jgi:hypothetical protein
MVGPALRYKDPGHVEASPNGGGDDARGWAGDSEDGTPGSETFRTIVFTGEA